MSTFLPTLYKVYDLVYDSVYDFEQNFYYLARHLNNFSNQKIMSKPNYSIPKIYTGGADTSLWNQLSTEEQKKYLKKDWYIYYSFRCPESGLLKRVTPIKGYANSYKTMKERMKYLNVMRDALELLLKNGLNPYTENDFSFIDEMLNEKVKANNTKSEKKPIEEKAILLASTKNINTIKDSFENVLKIKKNQMNTTSFKNYQLRIMRFMNFLPDTSLPIDSIVKKDVINFLNNILETTSPRSRNNYRTDLNSFFKELENNEYIENNFIAKINVLKSNPERNKTFSDKTQKDIYDYLEKEDKMLLLFIKFISYNFLRPVEVCRLKIKDIDINERKISVRAKNKLVKVKIIPEILINELPDLNTFNPESYLFTPDGFGMDWDIEENNKRDFFTKRFNKIVKKKFDLNKDFGLYSFRHTFITRLYRKLRENQSPQIAKSELMLITGHNSPIALEKYLRDIDAELPKDYSKLFEK
jgi:integrase